MTAKRRGQPERHEPARSGAASGQATNGKATNGQPANSQAANRHPANSHPANDKPAADGGQQVIRASAGSQDRWLRRLAAHCWRYPGLVLLALGGSLLATVVTAVIPLIQRNIIDNSILAHNQPIWPGAVLLIIAALLNFAGVYVRRYRAAGCPWMSSTASGPSCSARCPGWTGRGRTSCTPVRS